MSNRQTNTESANRAAKACQIKSIHGLSHMAKVAGPGGRAKLYQRKNSLIADFCRRYPEDVMVNQVRILPGQVLELSLAGNELGRIHTRMSVEQYKNLFLGAGRLLREAQRVHWGPWIAGAVLPLPRPRKSSPWAPDRPDWPRKPKWGVEPA